MMADLLSTCITKSPTRKATKVWVAVMSTIIKAGSINPLEALGNMTESKQTKQKYRNI